MSLPPPPEPPVLPASPPVPAPPLPVWPLDPVALPELVAPLVTLELAAPPVPDVVLELVELWVPELELELPEELLVPVLLIPTVKGKACLDWTPTADTKRLYVPLGRLAGVVNWQVSGVVPRLGIMVLKSNDLQ